MNEQAQEPPPLSGADLESAIHRLGSYDKGVSAEAERVVKLAGAEAIEPLAHALHREFDAYRKRRRIGFAGIALSAPCIIALLVLAMRDNPLVGTWLSRTIFIAYKGGLFVSVAYLILSVAHLKQRTILQKRTTAMLMGIDDVQAIGPLIDILCNPHADERTKVSSLLVPLLHRVRSSDSSLVDQPHRDHFRFVLKQWERSQPDPLYGTDYIVAILTALRQIGDARDLSVVKSIAYSTPSLHAAGLGLLPRQGGDSTQDLLVDRQMRKEYKPPIMQAALECLPDLQMQAEQQKVSNSLLRASGPSTGKSDSLLRPATWQESLEPQTLLRAVSDQADNQE